MDVNGAKGLRRQLLPTVSATLNPTSQAREIGMILEPMSLEPRTGHRKPWETGDLVEALSITALWFSGHAANGRDIDGWQSIRRDE